MRREDVKTDCPCCTSSIRGRVVRRGERAKEIGSEKIAHFSLFQLLARSLKPWRPPRGATRNAQAASGEMRP